jgi:DHA1 family multidrug resistance protein-like MFS transporter
MIRRLFIRYRPIIALALVAAVAEAAYAIINVLALPVFVDQDLDATHWLGLIWGSFLLVEALMKGPMGVLSDRFGRRALLVTGPIVAALTAFLITRIGPPVGYGQLLLLLLLRALDGVAAAAIWPTMFATMADQVDDSRRTSAMSVLTVSYMTGIAVGPYVGGAANVRFGSHHAAFYVVSGLFLLTSVMAYFLVPRRPSHLHTALHEPEPVIRWRDLVGALSMAPMMLFMAFIVFFSVGLLSPIAALYAMDKFHLDQEQFGQLFLRPAVVIGLLAMPLGKLGDHWGRARSVHLGLGVAALSMWALVLLPKTEWLLVIGAACLGLGFVIGIPAWLATVSEVAGERWRGTIIGAVATTEGLGCFVGVLIAPHLYKTTLPPLPSHELPVLLSALSLTIGFVLAVATIRPTRGGTPRAPELAAASAGEQTS